MEENKTLIYPAIVVAAYNRPNALQRLLGSIARADYTGYSNIPLVISIDGGGNPECCQIAEAFAWKYGEKRIIAHDSNMGLKKHILSCGDLTEQYGAVIMLEEDVYVSPYFYDYSVQTTSYYHSDDKITGVSLYLYRFHEYANIAYFMPIHNGYDVFFAQIPSSCGQVWTYHQWLCFRDWYMVNRDAPLSDLLPDCVRQWSPQTSWKLFFYAYMVACDKYFVYPYVNYSVNMGDAGQHMLTQMNVCQNLLMVDPPRSYSFLPFNNHTVVYDAHMELLPTYFWEHGFHINESFCVNLYGSKKKIREQYMLSILPCRNPIETYATDFIPIECNVLLQNFIGDISFGLTKDFIWDDTYTQMERLGYIYHARLTELAKMLGFRQGVVDTRNRRRYKIIDTILKPINCLRDKK